MSNFGIGIIGGTGFREGLEDLSAATAEERIVETAYGKVVLRILPLEDAGEVLFVARHGFGHGVPPHQINHRAHIAALKDCGAQYVLATSAVGSLHTYLRSGDLVVLDDFIDLRGGPPVTFFGGEDGVVRHTDFTEPFCHALRGLLLEEANNIGGYSDPPTVHASGVYLCLNGPRYETPAEVKLFASWGADVVGMTVAPEAILAREAGLCYASLAVVTNLAAGLSGALLSHQEVEAQMAASRPHVISLLHAVACRLLSQRNAT